MEINILIIDNYGENLNMKYLQYGFSMIELMIVITILAILTMIAAPSFSDLVSKSRLTSTTSTLVSDLNYARSEAIMRNAPVIVCAKVSNSPNCAAMPIWQTGWIVCIDADSDNVCDATKTNMPNPLRIRTGINNTTLIFATTAITRFSTVGMASGNLAFTVTGGPGPGLTRVIQVTSNGYVRSY
jgi:type IV fimbrial biogenesis protein FimT